MERIPKNTLNRGDIQGVHCGSSGSLSKKKNKKELLFVVPFKITKNTSIRIERGQYNFGLEINVSNNEFKDNF